MEITPLDVSNDAALRAYYDVDTRAMLAGRTDMTHWTWEEMSATYRLPDPGERVVLLSGYEDERLVGVATLFLFTMDNTDKGFVSVVVDPPAQGRGHGRALLAHALGLARADGRTSIVIETKVPLADVADHRYRRFAEAAGFTYSGVEVVRHLTIPVPEPTIHDWSRVAAEKATGYRIETFVDDVPAELVTSYCVLLGQLSVDAPTGIVEWEEENITPERLAENRRTLKAAGCSVYETMAITPDDVVAAHSTIVAGGHGKTDASQWGTFVHRDHRGHRLGLATKATNLLAVQRAHPEVRRVVTQNAEDNRWMIAINDQLGFKPAEASMELVIDL